MGLDKIREDRTILNFDELISAKQYPWPASKVPLYLPPELNAVYEDAEFNFLAGRWKAATQLYLQSLEFSVVFLQAERDGALAGELSATRVDLTKRINQLFDAGRITQSLKEWAHQIRVIGQFHKHRIVEASRDDSEAIRSFMELFLQYNFTIPEMISERRQKLK